MADIRINALATTAASTASDDFVAVDGSANGTRKLNAFSPTFGGNLTVSGTGGGTFTGPVTFGSPTNIGSASAVWVGGNGSSGAFFNVPTGANLQFGINNSGLVSITSTATTLQNNLTVSGTGVSTFSSEIAANKSGSNISFPASGSTAKSGLWTNADGTMTWGDYATGTKSLKLNTTTGDATLAGNLTVSGTGTSSVAGKLIVGSAIADNAVSKLQSNGALVVYGGAISNVPDAPSIVIDQQVGGVARIMASGTSTWSVPLCINPYGGNALFGTTTDSGNGKLQLATHSTSAGGIGFGTDVSLYRSAYGTLNVDGPTGAVFGVRYNGTTKLSLGVDATNGYIDAPASTIFRTNGTTTALTLDSSQRAIFSPARAASNIAVKIVSSGAATNADKNYLLFGHNTAANAAVVSQIDNTATGAMSLILASGTDSTGAATALTLDSSQNAAFNGGTITLGDYAGDQDVIIAAQSTGVGYLRWRPTASGTNAYGFSIAYDNPNTKLSFLRHEFSTAGAEWLSVARSTGNATFAGSIAIGNTVNTVSPTSPNRTITMVIGGTTYYIHAKTTND